MSSYKCTQLRFSGSRMATQTALPSPQEKCSSCNVCKQSVNQCSGSPHAGDTPTTEKGYDISSTARNQLALPTEGGGPPQEEDLEDQVTPKTVAPTATNVHGDAICFMVMGPSLLQRFAVCRLPLVLVGGWRLVVP